MKRASAAVLVAACLLGLASCATQRSAGFTLQPLASGVFLAGSGDTALVVEMGTHLIVFDPPPGEAESKAFLELAQKRFPGKPLRYLVLTRPDPAQGLRAYLAQGTELIVPRGAGEPVRRALSSPRTRIVEIADRYVLADGEREVDVLPLDDAGTAGALIGYVPDAKLGFAADTAPPALPSIVEALRKYGLRPERLVDGHGASADYAALTRRVGQ
jgi:hypothetical protein